MNLINRFKTKNSIQDFQEESKQILDVFTSTVSRLENVNNTIQEEVVSKKETIAVLEKEVDSLESIKASNATIMTKISALFS
jgi:hypothetical protein